MHFLLISLVFVLFASISSAAFVSGEIYTHDLEKLNKTVITVSGNYSYQLVSQNANYSIFLPEGRFNISASSFDEQGNLALFAQETIVVSDQEQRVDLVLKPIDNLNGYFVAFGLFLIIAATAILLDSKFRAKPVPEGQIIEQEQYPENRTVPAEQIPLNEKVELDEDAKMVLQVLESFENRATQKELKEALKFSDTKLSLILTELEHLGHIKKFKRGRANVVKKLTKKL